MALGFTSLDSDEETSSDGTLTTGSISPASGAMLYVAVVSTTSSSWNDDNGPHVTVSGLGGTWANIVDEDVIIYSPRRQLTVSRGTKGSAWGSGTLTITVDDSGAGGSLQDVAYTVDEITGHDSGDPDDAPVTGDAADNLTLGDVGTVDDGDAVFVAGGHENGANNFACTGYTDLTTIGALSNVRQIKTWYDDTSPDETPNLTSDGGGNNTGGAAWVINIGEEDITRSPGAGSVSLSGKVPGLKTAFKINVPTGPVW